MKRYIVERTNNAEIRLEEQSEKVRSCQENLWKLEWNSWKGHRDRNRHKNRIKRSEQARVVHIKDINCSIPARRRWGHGDSPQYQHVLPFCAFLTRVIDIRLFLQKIVSDVCMFCCIFVWRLILLILENFAVAYSLCGISWRRTDISFQPCCGSKH